MIRNTLRVEEYCVGEKKVPVIFVGKEEIAPAFGWAFGGIGQPGCRALVREDLSPRVKRFVIAHELYHLGDKSQWWGEFGKELRANLIPGLRDPVGLLACITVTLLNRERRRFYLNRLRGKV